MARKRPEEARKRPEEARRGPDEARKRPGRGQEEARKRPGRGPEEARRGPEEASPRGGGPRDVTAKTPGFRVYTFIPLPWVGARGAGMHGASRLALPRLRVRVFFAAREARAASGSAWRLSSL